MCMAFTINLPSSQEGENVRSFFLAHSPSVRKKYMCMALTTNLPSGQKGEDVMPFLIGSLLRLQDEAACCLYMQDPQHLEPGHPRMTWVKWFIYPCLEHR